MLGKNDLRAKNKEKRNKLTASAIQEASHNLCVKLMESTEYRTCDNLLVFASIQNEIDISELVQHAWNTGKNVYYPKTFGENMEFFKVTSLAELEIGNYKVPEPAIQSYPFTGKEALCIVPGLGFSLSGHRVGYGKGYYDRFLSTHPCVISIGVGYEFQFEDDFEPDEFDYKLNYLYSENGRK